MSPFVSTPEGIRALNQATIRGMGVFKPPPILTVSQWADANRKLSPESSAEPGQWVTARAEYQRGPMDAINDPNIETIVLMWSSQVGKTEILNNVVGYFIDQDPSPILLVQPTLDIAEAWSKDRLAPMLRDTPCLHGRVKESRARDSGNTLLHKLFPGGHITMAGANSPASLASRPIRIVIFDEVSRFPMSAGSEGNPVGIGTKRSTTFWNRKRVIASSPTFEGDEIDLRFADSDQRFYFVYCPHCGERQILSFRDGLKWPKSPTGKHLTHQAYYVCKPCGAEIVEADKPEMIRNGIWIPQNPGGGDGKTAGFWLNEMYSPWVTWADMAQRFLESLKSPELGRVFINTSLAETWKDPGETVSADPLFNRREEYKAQIPAGALILTAGVDIQADRAEVEIVGWGKDRESWGIEKKVIPGDPSKPQLWAELDKYLLETSYLHEGGVKLILSSAFVDSGNWTTEVYNFCKPRQVRKVFACKGFDGQGKPIAGNARQVSPKKGRRRALLYPVGVDTAKEVIYKWLGSQEYGPGFCHFPKRPDYDEEFFKQLTAEKITTVLRHGFPSKVWVKSRPRNEALDCRVYALAALEILSVKWDSVAEGLQKAATEIKHVRPTPEPEKPSPLPPQVRRPAPGRSNWVNSWKWRG